MGLEVTIELDVALEEYIRARAADSGYPSIAACIEDMIRWDQASAETLDSETLAKVREAFDEPVDNLPFFDPEMFHAELKSSLG